MDDNWRSIFNLRSVLKDCYDELKFVDTDLENINKAKVKRLSMAIFLRPLTRKIAEEKKSLGSYDELIEQIKRIGNNPDAIYERLDEVKTKFENINNAVIIAKRIPFLSLLSKEDYESKEIVDFDNYITLNGLNEETFKKYLDSLSPEEKLTFYKIIIFQNFIEKKDRKTAKSMQDFFETQLEKLSLTQYISEFGPIFDISFNPNKEIINKIKGRQN